MSQQTSTRSSLGKALHWNYEISIGPRGDTAVSGEPTPLYAQPYLHLDDNRLPIGKQYYVGILFANGMIEADGWEQQMQVDGLKDALIQQCRQQLDSMSSRQTAEGGDATSSPHPSL